MRTSPDRLIERIYEAAVAPEQWTDVLEQISGVAGCFGGTLIATRAPDQTRAIWTRGMHDLMTCFERDGWHRPERNTRASHLAPRHYAGFVSDLDLFTRDQIDKDPFYQDFLLPNGGGWAAGTIVESPSGDAMIFNLERRFADGPVTREACAALDQLRPHLARAALLSSRLKFEQARAMVQTLEAMGLPGAVLRQTGQVLAVNQLMSGLIPHIFQDRRDRLRLADPAPDDLLAGVLAASECPEARVRSIPIAGNDARAPMILHLLPVAGTAHDVFSGAAHLVAVTPVDSGAVPNADVLQGLFDLTPAEARVARRIGGAETVAQTAIEIGVSQETIRSHLKAIFRKTGVDRQTQLVALLSGTSPMGRE